ncbi:tetratricopeptide repeat protein [Anaerotignum lactatifermentans]|uniref:Tetratricopeptide repeat protein n=1 Tax=Anaerotignum lactatifermentans TaxID=160404 RepID=A0ABS2G8D0_9FIRM|nr:tetratricopeptide repeat protein [Anaerotignum lactatifermentans]MBM6828801.1 tetratricopeptide repeat protein [Anaerotignum lactatifermentans]MBM6877127.1 tetratricopeptide repeat protein [Anaerotignum lactatifermentans]MBM6950382.1 tetratricopeptide repeat protein [Anaerotignum lactatifermentans]
MSFYMGEIRKMRQELFSAYDRQDYRQALMLGRRILQLYLDHGDCDTMEYATDMHNLGVVFDELGRYDKAMEYYKKAAILKKDCAGESLSFADTLNNLAVVYSQTGQYEKALKYHRQVLQIRDMKLGREHIDYIHTLFQLGNTYEDLKQYEKAMEMQEKALEKVGASKQVSGGDLADIYFSMASAAHGAGNYKRSIASYEKALTLLEKENGEKTFYYMMQLIRLAEVCEKAGWMELAVEYCERAVQIRRELMSENHLDFINSLNALAALCCKAGDYRKALRAHEETLQLVREVLGEDHIFYAETLNNMSVDYAGLEEYEKALELNQEALERKAAIMGPDSSQCATSWMSLGSLYEKMGREMDALSAYRRALGIRSAIEKKELPCADAMEAMARLLAKRGAFETAFSYLREAQKIRLEAEGKRSFSYVQGLYVMAEIKREAGEPEAAVMLCREAAEIQEEQYGKNHPLYAEALEHLGKEYALQKRYEKSLAALTEAAAVFKEMLDEDNPRHVAALEEMAQVCEQMGDYGRAVDCYLERNDVNFEETAEEQKKAAETLLAIACCYQAMGQTKKAEGYFQEAESKISRLGMEPEGIYAQRRSRYLAAAAGETPREEAKREQKTAERKKLRETVALFETVIRQNEGHWDEDMTRYALTLGDLYLRLDQKEQAKKWLETAEKQADGELYALACLKAGELLLREGEYTKALVKFRNAASYTEEYGDVRTEFYCRTIGYLGDAFYQAGDKEKALQMYLPYVRLFRELGLPKDGLYETRMERAGSLLAKNDRHQEAAEYYSELALHLREKEGESPVFAKLLLKTAMSHMAQGNAREAETLLDRALLLGAREGVQSLSYGRLCDRIGRLYAANGSHQKAVEALLLAYELTRTGTGCLTKEGHQTLLQLLRRAGDEKRYFAVKNGEKVQ